MLVQVSRPRFSGVSFMDVTYADHVWFEEQITPGWIKWSNYFCNLEIFEGQRVGYYMMLAYKEHKRC